MRIHLAFAISTAAPLLASGFACAAGEGAAYGARDPLVCAPLRQSAAPTIAQATDLVRCRSETVRGGELWLMKDVRLRMGAGRPINSEDNSLLDPDISKPVHDLRGSFTLSVCLARDIMVIYNKNPEATGVCWWTNKGEWACTMGGFSASEPRPNMPPVKN